jgi:hypothetical protein
LKTTTLVKKKRQTYWRFFKLEARTASEGSRMMLRSGGRFFDSNIPSSISAHRSPIA